MYFIFLSFIFIFARQYVAYKYVYVCDKCKFIKTKEIIVLPNAFSITTYAAGFPNPIKMLLFNPNEGCHVALVCFYSIEGRVQMPNAGSLLCMYDRCACGARCKSKEPKFR